MLGDYYGVSDLADDIKGSSGAQQLGSGRVSQHDSLCGEQ